MPKEGENQPQSSRPTELHKPQIEAGNGARGIPLNLSERAKPPPGRSAQGRREVTSVQQPERHERQALPSVLDILERRAQLRESQVRDLRHAKSKHTRVYLALRNEHLEKMEQLGEEVASLYPNWEPRDQLIFDLYTTLEEWRYGLRMHQTQQFIAQVQPMSEDELRGELRKAQEVQERKAAIAKKGSETQRRNKNLTPEERYRLQKESARERSRAYQRRKRESRLQAEQPQPTQVFPDPPKSNTP